MIVLESCQVSSNQTVCLSMLTNRNCCFKTLEMNGMANLKLNLIEEFNFPIVFPGIFLFYERTSKP